MTAPSVTWVLCDDATHKEAPANALRLSLGGAGQSMTVEVGGIVASLSGRLRGAFHDLIRIAALVLGADGAISRGSAADDDGGERWHRRFRLVVGVDDPAFWNQPDLQRALEETLSFLSQDTFVFDFQPRRAKPAHQLVFSGPDGKPILPWDHVQEISLFSGGLDSFAGAADLVLAKRRSTILVSHRSSPKIWQTQTDLVADLAELAKTHGSPEPQHVAVQVSRHDKRLRTERTQRTRSFLYAAIAGAVADLLGHSRVFMHENGIVAINLPIAGSVVGSRATRTAHPQVLGGFARILSLTAGRPIAVSNPLALKTRPEIIRDLGSSPAAILARKTVSCAHVHQRSRMHPHCGVCSQCIDRQFGFLGAGLQEHDSEDGYHVQLTRGEWKDASSRSLLLNWIEVADRFASCTNSVEFLGAFGDAARAVPALMEVFNMDAAAASHAVFDLHRRHGQSIGAVLADVSARSAADVRSGRLKADTLPMLLYRQGLKKSGSKGNGQAGAENTFQRSGNQWRIRFRGGPFFELPDSPGLRCLSILLGTPNQVHTARGLVALAEGRAGDPQVVLNDRDRRAVEGHILAIGKERDEAQEFCDEDAACRCQTEIDLLRQVLDRADARPDEAQTENPDVDTWIRDALALIAKKSKALGDHITEAILVGSVFWHRRPALVWDVPPVPLFVSIGPQGRSRPPSAAEQGQKQGQLTDKQIIGWAKILLALGFEAKDRRARELVRRRNSETRGPIVQIRHAVTAPLRALTTWWNAQVAIAADKAAASERESRGVAVAQRDLANPGVRKDEGFHVKDTPNKRRR